jgi:hypothetical protein
MTIPQIEGVAEVSMTKKETSTLHIDTSLQIERCKATRRSQVVEQEIRQFRFLSTSTYAKLEFKRAWLQRLAYLYSLSGTVATTAELIGRVNERLSSHPLHQRQLSTCLEVIEAFLERSPGKLTDAARLVRMRAHLRNAVLVAYDWWESNVTHEYNGTDCARASERPRLAAGDRIDVSIPKCRRTNINCRLLGFLQENAQHLLAVKNQIDRPGSNASVELRGN